MKYTNEQIGQAVEIVTFNLIEMCNECKISDIQNVLFNLYDYCAKDAVDEFDSYLLDFLLLVREDKEFLVSASEFLDKFDKFAGAPADVTDRYYAILNKIGNSLVG